MILQSVYERPDRARVLYELLSEREPQECISHRRMPDFYDHMEFVEQKPYFAWYFIVAEEPEAVGAIYLTRRDEIGVHIFRRYRGKGYGSQAVKMLMDKHGPSKFLANINPANERSAKMFYQLGFKLLQNTYASS